VAIQAFVPQSMDRHGPSGLAMTRLVFVSRDDRVGRDEALTLSLRAVQRRGNPVAHHQDAIIAKILPRRYEDTAASLRGRRPWQSRPSCGSRWIASFLAMTPWGAMTAWDAMTPWGAMTAWGCDDFLTPSLRAAQRLFL
jgi:hypothetical protein